MIRNAYLRKLFSAVVMIFVVLGSSSSLVQAQDGAYSDDCLDAWAEYLRAYDDYLRACFPEPADECDLARETARAIQLEAAKLCGEPAPLLLYHDSRPDPRDPPVSVFHYIIWLLL